MTFFVSLQAKRYILIKEIGYWLAFKKINYQYRTDETLAAEIPAELMSQLGMIAHITVQNEQRSST